MLNYSTRFKELIKSDVRDILYELNITLVDGTLIAINNSHIWGDSLNLEDGTSENDRFTIGSAIATRLSFGLNNIYGDFNNYSFDRAKIVLKIGLMVDGVKEMGQVGVYTVDNADYDSSIISITALDNFIKMDSVVNSVSFPTTTRTLVQNICSSCGVTNMADSFLSSHNYDVIGFDYSNMTYRTLLAYLCQYMGCFAKMDTQGRLILKWYQDIFDDSTHTNVETIDTFSTLKLSTDFIEISGVEVVLDDEHKYSIGTDNYVVTVANNPLIVNEEMAIALRDRLYVLVGGYKFKKCEADTLMYIWFESGDVCYIQDKGVKYPIFISNRSLNSGGRISISCDAETPLRNSLVGNDSSTSAIRQLRQDLKKETDDRTRVEEELKEEIAKAGGVYETEVAGAEGEGGMIKYLHNKPLLADSAIQWKFTASTISVSNDYGQTWSFALNSNGQAILNQIYALGINADYIFTGNIKGLNDFKVEVYKTNESGEYSLMSNSLEISGALSSDASKLSMSNKNMSKTNSQNANYMEMYSFGNNNTLDQTSEFNIKNYWHYLESGFVADPDRNKSNDLILYNEKIKKHDIGYKEIESSKSNLQLTNYSDIATDYGLSQYQANGLNLTYEHSKSWQTDYLDRDISLSSTNLNNYLIVNGSSKIGNQISFTSQLEHENYKSSGEDIYSYTNNLSLVNSDETGIVKNKIGMSQIHTIGGESWSSYINESNFILQNYNYTVGSTKKANSIQLVSSRERYSGDVNKILIENQDSNGDIANNIEIISDTYSNRFSLENSGNYPSKLFLENRNNQYEFSVELGEKAYMSLDSYGVNGRGEFLIEFENYGFMFESDGTLSIGYRSSRSAPFVYSEKLNYNTVIR